MLGSGFTLLFSVLLLGVHPVQAQIPDSSPIPPASAMMSSKILKEMANRASHDLTLLRLNRIQPPAKKTSRDRECADELTQFYAKYHEWVYENREELAGIDDQIGDLLKLVELLPDLKKNMSNGTQSTFEQLVHFFVSYPVGPNPRITNVMDESKSSLNDLIQEFNEQNLRATSARIKQVWSAYGLEIALDFGLDVGGRTQKVSVDLSQVSRVKAETLWKQLAETDARIGPQNSHYTLNGQRRFRDMQTELIENTHNHCVNELKVDPPAGKSPIHLTQTEIDLQFKSQHPKQSRQYFRHYWKR